jgi:hypothetical protein
MLATKDMAEQGVEAQVVVHRARMHDDDMGHETHDFLDHLAPVLVDLGNHMGRRELPQHVELHVLGAADLGNAAQGFLRVYAESGAADQLPGEVEVADQFGQARHQADDTRRAHAGRMLAAQRVRHRHHRSRPRGFLPARANSASNTGLGSRRISLATTPICQGITV